MNNPEGNQGQGELKKKRYLMIGVWVFSIVFFALWLVNLKFSFQPDVFNINSQGTGTWQEDLNKSMAYFQDDLKTLNEVSKVNEVRAEGQVFLQDMTDNLTEQKIEAEIDNKDRQKLEMVKDESGKLLQTLENKINNNLSCPVLINCIPGSNRPETCSVPSGCEDITQIAY